MFTDEFTPEQERAYEQISDALRAHGYFIDIEPIPGAEDAFLAALGVGLNKVEETADYLRRAYGYRGLSRRLLRELHASLPTPAWGIEVSRIAGAA